MKKIIIAILCSTMFISNGFAISIIDAIQHSNSRGISQCSDRIASNYGAMAPCLYIRESAPRVMVAPHHNANISRHSNRVNPFHSNGHSANLVDTSAWHMTHTPTVTHTRTTNNTAINSEFIITQLEEFMSNTNNLSFKILNEDTVYITIDSDTTTNKIRIVMPVSLADSNNQWNKDVIIIASATDNRFAWDYVVVDMDANILAS